MEYPHRRIVQQVGRRSQYSTPLSRKGRDRLYGLSRLSYDQQWGKVWGFSSRTRSQQSSKGHKYGCLLWLSGGHKLGEWWLWMQRWKDEEIPEASKEMGGQPSGQVYSSPKGREQASWPSCKSCISRTHAHLQKGAFFFSSALAFDRWHWCARNRLKKQLDYTDNFVLERWHTTWR